MEDQEKKKIEDDAFFAGQSHALDWILKILEESESVKSGTVGNLKGLDEKCDEIREVIYFL